MKIKKIMLWILITIGVLAIAGCASQPSHIAYNTPSFFTGIFHGFIIIFSFIGSIFTNVRIYAFQNSGVMYDFGYLIGISIWISFNNNIRMK